MISIPVAFLIPMTCLLCLFVAAGVGANDVANAMGTSVGARVLTIKQAIIIAAIFEGLGALLASGNVTSTISEGVIDLQFYQAQPDILILGMIAALLAVGCWLVIATYYKWPVSTTHSIIGALIGFGIITAGMDHIHWAIIGTIFGSWVVTPIIAGIASFALFSSVTHLIIDARQPASQALTYLPIYIFFVAWILIDIGSRSAMPLLHITYETGVHTIWTCLAALIMTLVGRLWLSRRIRLHKQHSIEPLFGILAIFTACAMAFAHGSNDTANAIGPAATILHALNPSMMAHGHMPWWLLALGGFGVMTGLGLYGYRVIATIGNSITELTPSRSFAAQLATASTVIFASYFGLPVSTTQILIGAVLGVGLAKGITAINLSVVRSIFLSWLVTLPAGATLTACFYFLLRYLFQIAW